MSECIESLLLKITQLKLFEARVRLISRVICSLGGNFTDDSTS